MSLAMGLAAVDEYFREGERRELRERDRKRFGWESQRAESEMSLLGDKTEADRLSFRDRASESGARIATRPQRTANEISRLRQEGVSLERAGARQGKVEDTADVAADYSLADAKFKLGQQPTLQQTQANTNEVGLQTSAQALESNPALLEAKTNQTLLGLQQSRADLKNQPARLQTEANTVNMTLAQSKADVVAQPMKIAQQAAAGTVSQMQAQGQLLSNLYEAIQTGNQNVVRTYIQNSLNTGLFPQLKGKKVGEVGSIKGADGKPVIVAKDDAGQVIFQMSMDELQRVRDAMAKPETMKLNDGDTVVQVKGGKATPLYTAPVSPSKAAERMGPLERDVGYLMKFHGKTKDEALAFVNSAKTMSRNQFVLKSITDSVALGKKPTDAEIAEFGAIYDRATRGGPRVAPPAAPGATPARPPMDPALSRLLGIQ